MKCPHVIHFLFLVSVFVSLDATHTLAIHPDEEAYDIQDRVLIKTRDGASLSATLVRKKGNLEPLPTVLFYTTYDQGDRDLRFGKLAADRGYVGMVVYARGIRTNLNDYMPYEHESNDIYDVIDWISKQSWGNGKVGMYGGSYSGFAQWAAVKHVHPALKTIVPQVAVMPGYDTPMENNVCATALCLGWPQNRLSDKPLSQDVYNRWYAAGTSYRTLDTLAGQPNRIFQKWLQHPDYDEYWRSLIPTPAQFARLNIPILTTTGYYDGAQIGAIQFVKLQYKYNPKANTYMVIGPYDHPGAQRNPAPNLMGYNIDPVAIVNMEDLAYEWFNYILKDGKKPALLKAKINFEVMGGNEWRHASSLTTLSNQTLKFFLSDRVVGDSQLLAAQKPAPSRFLQQTVDFNDRTTQNNLFTRTIINSNPGTNALVFVSEPFADSLTINGSFSGQLAATINKMDMDISIAFYELMPDGNYFFLTRYIGRASYAKDKTQRHLLRPGIKEIIPLGDIRMVSKKVSKGSRLVIALQVNKNPFEIINYGSGKNVYDETIKDAKQPLQIKWYTDSYITVPIAK
jgi:putative CocE/NonD family hydrolase